MSEPTRPKTVHNLALSRRSVLKVAAAGAAAAALASTGESLSLAAQSTPGGQITLTWRDYPLTFNPLDPIGGVERTVWQLTTSRLINKDVTGAIIPDFAESYEVAPDGLSYTFHLAKNAAWSDGTPVTARDVEFTYTLVANPKTGALGFTPASSMEAVEGVAEYLAGAADTISGIKVLDDYTIQFVLTRPDAPFLAFIDGYYGPYLVPAHILGSVPAEQFSDHEYNTNPVGRVGMGPYLISEAEKDQFVVFTRNDSYFKGKPLIDQFNFRVMQPDVALAALLNGEVDVARIPAREYATIKEEGTVRVITFQSFLWNGLMFNMSKPELTDPRIHEAVLRALDRQTFADRILNGLGAPWDSIYCQPQWLSDEIVHYGYDPERAKSLLAEANWDSDRVLDWKYYDNGLFAELAPVLQQGLADVGFKINLVQMETAAWVQSYEDGDFDFSVVGGGGITDDPNEMANYFQCDVWSRYCNQEILDLFDQGRKIVDDVERKEIYDRIQEIINQELPWLPLFANFGAVGFSQRVKEVAYSQYDYLYYEQWSVDG